MLEKLVNANRSYRSFDESKPITREQLIELVDLARRTASANNKQPLRYRVVSEKEECEALLAICRFAGRLTNVKLPPEGQHPTGYIVIYSDSEAGAAAPYIPNDVGIAAQTILLAATEKGFGGCMIGSASVQKLQELFQTPARYVPCLVIALGKPAEFCCLVEAKNGDTAYYRDENGIHYVPKLPLEEILL